MQGGAGDDTLVGGMGSDILNGGLGVDTCYDEEPGTVFRNCEVILP